MKKVLLTNFYEGEPLALVKSLVPNNLELLTLDKPGRSNILNAISEADYVLAGGREKIDEEVLLAASNLKMIHRSGVGLDALDLAALREHNISLYVSQGINAQSVAEHTLLLVLGTLRRIGEVQERTRAGEWVKHQFGIHCRNLRGKTVGLIGFGKIAKEFARLLTGFDVEVVYFKPEPMSDDEEATYNTMWLPFDELLARVDILSLHCGLTDGTFELINKNSLIKMKPGSIIINTARGGLINELDLIDALNSGQISAAGLDVFAQEPLPKDHPFLRLPNVLLTPHIGSITRETFSEMIGSALQNISFYDAGQLDKITSQKLI